VEKKMVFASEATKLSEESRNQTWVELVDRVKKYVFEDYNGNNLEKDILSQCKAGRNSLTIHCKEFLTDLGITVDFNYIRVGNLLRDLLVPLGYYVVIISCESIFYINWEE
jgi:hypothetical protein